jgi:hypothetical protein
MAGTLGYQLWGAWGAYWIGSLAALVVGLTVGLCIAWLEERAKSPEDKAKENAALLESLEKVMAHVKATEAQWDARRD